jgi:hypothetical protein
MSETDCFGRNAAVSACWAVESPRPSGPPIEQSDNPLGNTDLWR